MPKRTLPVHAREGDTIEIHWKGPKGTYLQRITSLPTATTVEIRDEHDAPGGTIVTRVVRHD